MDVAACYRHKNQIRPFPAPDSPPITAISENRNANSGQFSHPQRHF